MEYAKVNKKYCCGIDLHGKSMYVFVMDRTGEIHYHMKNDFLLRNTFNSDKSIINLHPLDFFARRNTRL